VYDIAYGTVRAGEDNLVVVDDSIVRGTTLKRSILRILDRLGPRRIVVASSAPQIRYPDCYGIDMARLGDFVAFQAAVALLHERGLSHVLDATYAACLADLDRPKEENENRVRAIYAPFTEDEISSKISELLTPRTSLNFQNTVTTANTADAGANGFENQTGIDGLDEGIEFESLAFDPADIERSCRLRDSSEVLAQTFATPILVGAMEQYNHVVLSIASIMPAPCMQGTRGTRCPHQDVGVVAGVVRRRVSDLCGGLR
jgi:hypothetical protein